MFWLGSAEADGFCEVVDYDFDEGTDGEGDLVENAAPSECEVAFVAEHRVFVLAVVAAALVTAFPCGGFGGDALVTVEFVDWDADPAFTAVFVVDGKERKRVFVGCCAGVASFGGGLDSPCALGTDELDTAVF